jgi:sulfite reductase beta subunit-like hemoprotein
MVRFEQRAPVATTECVTGTSLSPVLQDHGVGWFRAELELRWNQPLHHTGVELRKRHHIDHCGIHSQKSLRGNEGPALHAVGLLVPVGRIATPRYGAPPTVMAA